MRFAPGCLDRGGRLSGPRRKNQILRLCRKLNTAQIAVDADAARKALLTTLPAM